jgi:hypothetical protein
LKGSLATGCESFVGNYMEPFNKDCLAMGGAGAASVHNGNVGGRGGK